MCAENWIRWAGTAGGGRAVETKEEVSSGEIARGVGGGVS